MSRYWRILYLFRPLRKGLMNATQYQCQCPYFGGCCKWLYLSVLKTMKMISLYLVHWVFYRGGMGLFIKEEVVESSLSQALISKVLYGKRINFKLL